MAKNKGVRINITLECNCRQEPQEQERGPGIYRYTTTKNRRNSPSRLELSKYCPKCNKHALFKEIK
uniref:ribosomal protein L33 n=1 Tax=Chroodactylon ornatum TaxID=139907 RepID=UPI001FCDBDA9|nr:ribosomal protein L33 [Chroodactylon ornatum]UNJ14648.1 ribosomal protein L33 [Chroodactylon ornatum]